METLKIDTIRSGGIITNYYCSSRCRHCLYCCSPQWEKEYMNPGDAADIFKRIKKLGCFSVHIGGGEPFLNFPALCMVLEEAEKERIGIEYIETNSSWYTDTGSAVEKLEKIRRFGVNTLLVSISPFHNEIIPFYKVKGVMNACEEAGINIFPWVSGFYNDIDSFDDTTVHSLDEYSEKFGEDYLETIPSRYWIHNGGRALSTFSMLYKKRKTDDIAKESGRCFELEDSSHFHFDLFKNYIPGLCSGLSIRSEDTGKPLDEKIYPFITILYSHGIGRFLEVAVSDYGFTPRSEYATKCHLCFDIRSFLVNEKNLDSPELKPKGIYKNSGD
jgi:hypothetical protein